MVCCICGCKCVCLEENIESPGNLSNQYDTDQLMGYNIKIYYCSSCAHMQIPRYLKKGYYNNYMMGAYWGEGFTQVRKKQMERLVKFETHNHRFLDIGCGVGNYLALAQEYYKELWGVEPSVTSSAFAKNRGYNIINDYFSDDLPMKKGFDAISIIEVLEHIEQPIAFFNLAASWLNDNGVLLVEVPNGQRIYTERLYYNLSTDHIQYFSVHSITEMAHRSGLSVLCAQESENPNLLELYAKKIPLPNISFIQKREQDIYKLVSVVKTAKVAAWGAGSEALCFLAALSNKIDINCVFDNDQRKHGHKVANIPIKKPTKDHIILFDYIIIFANSHLQEIQNQIARLGFKGSVLTLDSISD